jgi:hypothetical protein
MKRFVFKSLFVVAGMASLMPVWADSMGSDQFTGSNSEEMQKLLKELTPLAAPAVIRATPGTTFGTPTAYGANWGQAFAAYEGSWDIFHTKGWRRPDGSMSMGMGAGDASATVGLEVDLSLNSLSNTHGETPGQDGDVGFKIHKIFSDADNLGVAIGWSNAAAWGTEAKAAPETKYAVVTKNFALNPSGLNKFPVSVSLGAGTGAFASLSNVSSGRYNRINSFGSVGIVLLPELSFATSWTGSGLNVGFGISPFATIPLSFTVGVVDATNKSGTGSGLTANAGYMFQF